MKSLLIIAPTAMLIAVMVFGVPSPLPGQSAPSAAPARVSVVSAQRLLVESAVGKAEVARMQAAQRQRLTDLRTLQQTLESTRAQIKQAADVGAMAKLQQLEQQQRFELERATAQANTELQNLQRQMQTDLQAKIKPIVEEIAKARGFDIVLSADVAAVWAAPAFDLTPAVLQRLNAQ